MVRMDIFKQYFKLSTDNITKLQQVLTDINNSLVTYKMVIKKSRYNPPTVSNEIDKLLYIVSVNPDESGVIRYPISILDSITKHLDVRKIEYKNYTNEPVPSLPIDINFNPNKPPKEYQKKYIKTIINTELNNMLVDLQTGRGKALDVNTPIRVQYGWKRIGDINIGDIVVGKDGKDTSVTGVYPQGVLDLYRVTFEDGRFVDVCLEHLWEIYTNNICESSIINTSSILSLLEDNNDCYIDLPIPRDSDVPMSVNLYDIGNEISLINNSSHELKVSCVEFNVYLEAPVLQRIELLKGILGIIDPECTYIFLYKTKDVTLATKLQELVRGLGGKCSLDYTDNIYNLNINIVNIFNHNPDSIESKLRITSIEKSITTEAVCISVDNADKLFVVKDYIVTHNTLISLVALSEIKKRFMVLILPRYIGKWIDDITSDTDIQRDEILVIQGLTYLIDLLDNPDLLEEYKAFIVSLTTITLFISHYLNRDVEKTHYHTPEDVVRVLKIDTILNDESHQNFYGVFRFMLFSNNRLTLGLTATLYHNDENISKMYEIGFPSKNRISNIIPYNKYIVAYFVRYRFRNKKIIKFKNNFGYDKYKFEKSILRYVGVKNNYFGMIYKLLTSMYMNRKRPNDKAVVFMGSVRMCEEFVSYMSTKSDSLKVTKYTEEEKYEVISKNDLIVSTVPSAGTALDIPNLINVIMTVNTDSIQDNIQVLGRLRELPDMEVIYVNIWSSDIRPHTKYHYNMRKYFTGKVKEMRAIEYRNLL